MAGLINYVLAYLSKTELTQQTGYLGSYWIELERKIINRI